MPEEVDRQEHPLNVFESFAVVEEKVLRPFTFERVLNQLVAQSGIPGLTSLQLFNQWWDTQNTGPSLGMGPHCDDQAGFPGLNQFPWECPRLEGHQAFDPFELPNDPLYIPIGLFNRFDLAPANGAHCGEYRIVYGMRPGHPLAQGKGRNFIIFEAILPNPNPAAGLSACKPIAQFWADLTGKSVSQRRAELEKFYFHGIFGFEPVVHVTHYGMMLGANGYGCSTGQIRTNQFEQGPWNMREFKLTYDCRCGPCKLVVMPMTVKTNPFGEMFNVGSTEPRVPLLESTVSSQVASLSIPDLNLFTYDVSDRLNAPDSPIDDSAQVNNYLQQFQSPPNPGFSSAIAANIPPGSPLTPDHIVARAHALSCAGCHEQSNFGDMGDGITWPPSLGFTHVNEFISGGSYPVSPALSAEFLPFREQLLIDFLTNGPPPGAASKCAIELPPSLAVSKTVCEATKNSPPLDALPTAEVREMRTRWEGQRFLGRRASH